METNNDIVNLSEHRWDGSWRFFDEAICLFGNNNAHEMARALEILADGLQIGMSIDIPGLCKNEKKIPTVVKMACVIASGHSAIQNKTFVLNSSYTKLIRTA